MMKSKDVLACEALLREYGYRVTSGRVALLIFLKHSKSPSTVGEIQKGMSTRIDKVTLYRALEDFITSKVVGKIHLQDTASYYELLHKDHHHHIVCEKCGMIEDIKHCKEANLQKETLRFSKHFTAITSHSLEFFGLCKSCNRK